MYLYKYHSLHHWVGCRDLTFDCHYSSFSAFHIVMLRRAVLVLFPGIGFWTDSQSGKHVSFAKVERCAIEFQDLAISIQQNGHKQPSARTKRERERDDWMRFNRCAPRCRRKYGLDSAVVGENLGPKNQVGVRVGLANSARGRPGLGTS